MSKSPVHCRLARPGEEEEIIRFVNRHFDWKLPLINLPEYFQYYYCFDGQVQFALAEADGEWQAAAGYILASRDSRPDLWVSVWVAKKGCNGAGLELMAALPGLTGARVIACHNIRPETRPFYEFLGWHTGRVGHFYRMADLPEYRLARPVGGRLPVSGDLMLDEVGSVTRLQALGLPPCTHTPHKDLWYISRRYFRFPHRSYRLYSVGEKGRLLAYLALRLEEAFWEEGDRPPVKVLRVVDYIGDEALLPRLGAALDRLLAESGAEYADWYCAGIDPELLAGAGFTQRREGDGALIPNYLTPIAPENTEYYYFTSQAEGFTLFKADGDQDRPNLSVY